MAQNLFANNASCLIANSVSPSDTTIQLATGSGAQFPQPVTGQQFCATLYSAITSAIYEIVNVTAMNGDVATVVRAQEGTAALNWNVNDIFENNVTAATLAAFKQSSSPVGSVYTGSYVVNFSLGAQAPAFDYTQVVYPTGTWTLNGPTGMFITNYVATDGTLAQSATWYYLLTRTA